MSESELVLGSLPNRKVLIKPVVWEGWLNKNHSGAWLNDGAVMTITVPLSRGTGELINPLSKEEQEFFEDKSRSGMDFNQGDLSPYKKPDERTGVTPYWYRKEVIVRKPNTIVDTNTVVGQLDLSNPEQYLEYKILKANTGIGGIVAKSWEERFDQGTHRIVLVEDGYDSETKARTAEDTIKAYGMFGKISKSQTKCYEFLSVYWLENAGSVKPSVDAKIDFMLPQIEDIIKTNPKEFVRIMEDNYEDKLMVHNALRLNFIKIYGSTFVLLPEEKPMGTSLKEVVLYFKDDRNQEDKLKLLAQIGGNTKK